MSLASDATLNDLQAADVGGDTAAEIVIATRAVVFSNTGQAGGNGTATFAAKRLGVGQEDWHTR
jgi:hypothetical protein